jgi:hypothetical protein
VNYFESLVSLYYIIYLGVTPERAEILRKPKAKLMEKVNQTLAAIDK